MSYKILAPDLMPTQDWGAIADTLVEASNKISEAETVSLRGAIGRILAEPLVAAKALPETTHAVMDGYALGSSPPGHYRLLDGPSDALGIDEASTVLAGAAIPKGTAGVVLARYVQVDDHRLSVTKPLSKDNIRRVGEEAKQGEALLPLNTQLDARHIALASAAAVGTLIVRRRPRIALVGLHEATNAFPHMGIMQAMLNSPALDIAIAGVVREPHLQELLQKLAMRHDLIVVVAESLDAETGPLFTNIAALGGKATLYRAALKPAKPLITGRIGQAQILGLAGTAYATTAAAHLFLQPMLRQMVGLPQVSDLLPAKAGFSRSREAGRAEALPAKLIMCDGQMAVTLAGRFGQLRALADMEGFALIPASMGDIKEGMSLPFKKLLFPLV